MSLHKSWLTGILLTKNVPSLTGKKNGVERTFWKLSVTRVRRMICERKINLFICCALQHAEALLSLKKTQLRPINYDRLHAGRHH